MEHLYPKIIETPHYHLWTDALHARSLAHQARNKWDRGTYVRWTVTTAWTVLEIACQEALEDNNISYSFQKNIDAAIERKSLPSLDWGQGLWQKVTDIQKTRKGYVHRFLMVNDLFLGPEVADNAITVIREAVVSIYSHANRIPPAWIQDDEDKGWDGNGGSKMSGAASLIHAGASLDDPKVIKICYIRDNKEHISEVLPPGSDPMPYLEDLIQHVTVPISGVRAYEGNKIVFSKDLPMRGT